jgi:hypothetical protein
MKRFLVVLILSGKLNAALTQENLYFTFQGKSLKEVFDSQYDVPFASSITGYTWVFFCEVSEDNGKIVFSVSELDNDTLKASIVSFFQKVSGGWNLKKIKKRKVLIPIRITSCMMGELSGYRESWRSHLQSGDYFVFTLLQKYDEILCIDADPPGIKRN